MINDKNKNKFYFKNKNLMLIGNDRIDERYLQINNWYS